MSLGVEYSGSDEKVALSMREAFNGTVVSSAICAAVEVGLFDELADHSPVTIGEFCEREKLHRESVDAVVLALTHAQIVVHAGAAGADAIVPGALFAEARTNQGFFLWLVGGYGRMLSTAGELCRIRSARTAATVRDGTRIAQAGEAYGKSFVDPYFQDLVAGFDFDRAADLGCGSARRLVDLARTHPDRSFIGVERDEGAVEVARGSVVGAGVADRVQITHGDITALRPGQFPQVELVFSFFLGHDLWPRQRCLRVLDGLRRAFPDAQAFLLSDTYRSGRLAQPDTPIFTLGFEYTHALMTQHIPSLDEWRSLFEASSWELAEVRELAIPYSAIFTLRPNGDDDR